METAMNSKEGCAKYKLALKGERGRKLKNEKVNIESWADPVTS
jgi:hypothetical protein